MIVHEPVLLNEVLEYLAPPAEGGLMIDATLGQGGHAEAFLSRYPRLSLIGVDADLQVLQTARERLAAYSPRVELVRSWFRDFFSSFAGQPGRQPPDLILFDLGISRFHYMLAGRGFSFEREEALDMRLDESLPSTAADIVNTADHRELARILGSYGEERYAGQIAARIARERLSSPITTATRLAAIIAAAVPPEYRRGRIHPATRSFQALRIAVNGELEQLEEGLAAAFSILKNGGRIGVISFHSLEDRIVKTFFNRKARGCTCPPDWPICKCGGKTELRILTRKPARPTAEEASANPASRSAKLRVAQKEAA